jgi:DNA-binding NarL/FixJ family response regulator
MVLGSQPGLQVVGEASSAVVALRDIPPLAPHVVLMDVRMPTMDGLEATRRLVADHRRRALVPPRVLVLTTLDTLDATYGAIAAGADGFMLKDTEPEFLVAAIRALANGTRVIATGTLPDMAAPAQEPAEFAHLTSRERDVFTAVAHGLNNREIAANLFLSEATVKTHMAAILHKLGLRDRIQVVVYAYRHSLAG